MLLVVRDVVEVPIIWVEQVVAVERVVCQVRRLQQMVGSHACLFLVVPFP